MIHIFNIQGYLRILIFQKQVNKLQKDKYRNEHSGSIYNNNRINYNFFLKHLFFIILCEWVTPVIGSWLPRSLGTVGATLPLSQERK